MAQTPEPTPGRSTTVRSSTDLSPIDESPTGPRFTRPGWDDYFLGIAHAVARRADCRRRQVGAVLVSNNRIVATGYNGGPPGGPSCLAGQCPRGLLGTAEVAPGSSYDTGPGSCIALHAEQNCLLYADRSRAEHATIYVTHEPCEGCRRMIAGSGVDRAVWPGGQWLVREAVAPR